MGVFIILMTMIAFPLGYAAFRVEHYFKLSKQSFLQWLWDGVKGFFLNLIFSLISVEVIYILLRAFPHGWWLFASFFYFLFTVILGRITPTLILPLFYKVEPLKDSSLVEKLKALAHRAGVKVLGVFQMDMSRKTKKANAMCTGLGSSKRIILGDTLITHFSPDEIEVVLAHELGHDYHRHLWRLMTLGLFASLSGFFCASQFLGRLILTLHLNGIADVAGLPILLLILFLFSLLLMPFQNGYSRKLEKQADQFALDQTRNVDAFTRAMKKLAEQNLSEMNPPRWVEIFLYDHPSIHRRIQFAQGYFKKA